MTLSEYAIRSLHLDRQLRKGNRIIAFGVEALRVAGIAALLLVLSDLSPWAVLNESPAERARFVGFSALFMAAVNLIRTPSVEAALDTLDRDAAS